MSSHGIMRAFHKLKTVPFAGFDALAGRSWYYRVERRPPLIAIRSGVMKRWKGTASSSISLLALALAPKCPICLAALLGPAVVSSIPLVWALNLTLVAVPLVVLVRPAPCGVRRGPVAAGIAGAALALAGRLAFSGAWAIFLGMAVLASALIWRLRAAGECCK